MNRIAFSVAVSALALGAVTAVAPSLAQAQQGNGGQGMFARMDADNNGAVSLEEFQASMAARFQAMDADGDGAVTMQEMQASRGQARMGGMQAGRQGKQERMQRFGSMMHGDGDGHGQMRQMHVRPGMQDAMRGAVSPEMRLQRAERMIQMRDADGDGLLSLEELSAEMNADTMFARADTDGDGAISKAEFDAMRQLFGNRGRVMPEDLE